MNSLADIFSSAAKVRVLESLCTHAEPLSLRRLSALCEVPIRSIALAVLNLERQAVLCGTRENNRGLYTLNRKYPQYDLLHQIFQLAARALLRQRAASYAQKAKAVLAYQTSALSLLQRGRENRRA